MRRFLFVILIMIFAVSFSFSQTGIEESETLKAREVLEPTIADINTATTEGLNIFKILPRGMFDYEKNPFSIRGGGAYYSFTKKSHSYNETPQIELQKDKLLVGFYGASYGFIADLGKIHIESVTQTKEFEFASNYQTKTIESEVRSEQKKFDKYEENGILFQDHISYEVGNTYLLRAISYREADTLVAFKIHRQDSDGSLIIFWKHLKDFEIPNLVKAD